MLGLVAFTAEPARAADTADKTATRECHAALDALGVTWKPAAAKKGIVIPVEIPAAKGKLPEILGVTFVTWSSKKQPKPMVLDCSLAYSFARAARFFTDAGVTTVLYSGIYQRRNVRGTDHLSKHSFALAMDVHELHGDGIGELTVADDYEQGLGDEVDCVGKPLTTGGRVMRTVFCRMQRSELYKHILGPDYDADHWNHFHIEARPWADRTDVTHTPASKPAAKQGAKQAVKPAVKPTKKKR